MYISALGWFGNHRQRIEFTRMLTKYLWCSLIVTIVGTVSTALLIWSYDLDWVTLSNETHVPFHEQRIPQFACLILQWLGSIGFILGVFLVKGTNDAPTNERIFEMQMPLFLIWMLWPLILVLHLYAKGVGLIFAAVLSGAVLFIALYPLTYTWRHVFFCYPSRHSSRTPNALASPKAKAYMVFCWLCMVGPQFVLFVLFCIDAYCLSNPEKDVCS